MRKRLIANFLLLSLLLLVTSACGKTSIEGSWTAKHTEFGFEFSMLLNEDKTFSYGMEISTTEGTYTYEDNILEFTQEGGIGDGTKYRYLIEQEDKNTLKALSIDENNERTYDDFVYTRKK